MSKFRRTNNAVDKNQKAIVKELRQIGASVVTGHDDILVGYRGRTYWYEIKSPDTIGKDGKVRKSELKDSQIELIKTFKGHYRVVTSSIEIINEITAR